MSDEKPTKLKGSSGYVSWHTHSDMSQLDGAARLEEYAKVAKDRGDPALGISDHGTMRGLVRQHEACAEEGIKPIFGTEFYVARDMSRRGVTEAERAELGRGKKAGELKLAIKAYEEREGIRDRWHTTVWAMNQVGLKNLFRLSSLSWLEGFYYKPRIDLKRLMEYHEGLIVSTGCLSSPINDLILQGKKRESADTFEQLAAVFGERLVIELQPHAIRDQRVVNQNLIRLRGKVGAAGPRLLAAQDSHYIYRTDAPHHEVMLCIGTNAVLSTPPGDGPGKRFAFDGDEFHFRDRTEMIRAFGRHHEFVRAPEVKEALDSTIELAEMCTAKLDIDYHKGLLPTPDIPAKYEGNTFRCLADLCLDGWRWRRMDKQVRALARRKSFSKEEASEVYRKRLRYELGVLKEKGFDKYFLVVWDIYRFARESGIMTGPGRGSVGGSLVAYLIGITSVDPIEHDLIFERFMNPDRVDMPDIDMDFEDRRRGEIVQYLKRKYGEDKVAQIATVGMLSGKECLRSVSRVLEIPMAEIGPVTKAIIERSSGDERKSQTIEDSFRDFDVCRKFDKKYPKVLYHAKRLEGLAKTLGIHAAGVVTSPIPLIEVVPLEMRDPSGERKVVTAVDYEYCAALGLVKLDVLGLRTLSCIGDANKMIARRHGKPVDFENLEEVRLDDGKVLEAFTRHDYIGIFQYDTPSADKVCQGVTFDRFDDVAAMVALNRPGTSRSGLATKFVQRKKDPELAARDDYHPKVTEITKDTLGIMVYQEHIVRIFTEIAGFAPGASDSLRKAIAKKHGDETIGRERERFIDGAEKHSGIKKSIATKIFNDITFFGCLPGDTLVATPLGFRRMDELQSGDPIFSYDYKSETPIANRIRTAGSSGRKQVFKIRFKRIARGGKTPPGEVRASEGHWWLMSDGTYRKTSELREGAVLCSVVSPAGYSIQSIQPDGEEETFDLECADGPANYILQVGLVSHNSYGFNKAHSVEYGMISYWQMWLKVYYPLEFYYGLLKNEPDRIQIQSIAKDAKNHGIELLPPHISTSATEFTVDAEQIRGSLVDIKDVGEKAAQAVMDGQPYKDFADFATRIDRRKVNRRAVGALARSGAMQGIIPNLKWFVDHMEKLWDHSKTKPDKVQKLLEGSKALPDYDKDELMIIASSANPLAFGKHPIEAYQSFLETLPIKIVDSSPPEFLDKYNGKSVFVAGMFTEVRYNQIGDFHSGAEPDSEEKRMMFWGERYANVTIEDAGGKQHRCRFDIEIFETHRATIDRGVGCPVLLFATASNFTSRLWARFVIPLDEARKLSKELGDDKEKRLTASLWWRLIAGDHPALAYPWKESRRLERRTNARFWKEKHRAAYCGVVVNIKKKYDRKGNLMAFIGVYGPEGRLIEIVVFSRDWDGIAETTQVGSLVVVDVKKDMDEKRGMSYLFSDGRWLVVKRLC